MFLRSMVTRILMSYILLGILDANADPEVSARLYTLAKVPAFGRVSEISSEELLMRVGSVIVAAIVLAHTQRVCYPTSGAQNYFQDVRRRNSPGVSEGDSRSIYILITRATNEIRI